MPIDPNIALQYRPPDVMSPAQMISLRNVIRAGQLKQLQLTEATRQMQQQNAIRQRLGQPGATEPQTGMPTLGTISDITKLNPQLGMQMAGFRAKEEAATTQEEQRKLKIADDLQKWRQSVGVASLNAADAAGNDPVEQQKAAMQQRNKMVQEAVENGYLKHLGVGQEGVNQMLQAPLDIQDLRNRIEKPSDEQWSQPYPMGGATVQRNLKTGEVRTAVSRPPITNVFGAKGKPPAGYLWGPNDEQGNPTLIPIKHGPADVGESADEVAKSIANYRLPMLTGWVLKSPWGQRVMGKVTELNPQYDARLYQAGAKVISDFAGGKTGQMVQSFNVVIQHTGVMRDAAEALKNGDVRAFNAITQRFAQETGSPAPTNFDAVKRIWGDEITKAVTGSAGALGDREALERSLSRANSPEQLMGVMDQYERLMAGQVLGARKRYEANSGRKDFNKFLLPATLDAMKKHGYQSEEAPADIKSAVEKSGWSYEPDKYEYRVSPEGKVQRRAKGG